MKAIEIRAFGGLDVLNYTDVPVPSPADVDVMARRQIALLPSPKFVLPCQIALNRLPVFALKASPPFGDGLRRAGATLAELVGLRSRGGFGFQRALRVEALKPGS